MNRHGALSDREQEVLLALCEFTDRVIREQAPRQWARPQDVGGHGGSRHGETLQVQSWDAGQHKTYFYQISDKGRQVLEQGE
jgi:hypothetical protein